MSMPLERRPSRAVFGLRTRAVLMDRTFPQSRQASHPLPRLVVLILPRRDIRARDLAVDALEQSGQDSAGPDFVEGVEAVGHHGPHRVFPANTLKDLGDQRAPGVVGVVVWPGGGKGRQ